MYQSEGIQINIFFFFEEGPKKDGARKKSWEASLSYIYVPPPLVLSLSPWT